MEAWARQKHGIPSRRNFIYDMTQIFATRRNSIEDPSQINGTGYQIELCHVAIRITTRLK